MSEQTRRAFLRHFERALIVGNPATIADYFQAAEGDPLLLDELTRIQHAAQAAA